MAHSSMHLLLVDMTINNEEDHLLTITKSDIYNIL
jgi:hypothetical protein